jgi:hypothetical protein
LDVQSLREVIFPVINKAITQIEEDKLDYNITMLRSIMNEALNGALNINHFSDTKTKGLFSGRGRAWARTSVDLNNEVWVKIKEALKTEAVYAGEGSKMYEACTNLLDMFEDAGFAWMRFVRSKKGVTVFSLRMFGSKLEDNIKLYISDHYIKNGDIQNLEGVPHKLGLENGVYERIQIQKKEIINIPVESKDLSLLGIQSLEDILSKEAIINEEV